MKLAIVHPDFCIKGGAENVIFWLVEDLTKDSNWDVTIVSVDFGDAKSRLAKVPGLKMKEIGIPKGLAKSQIGRLLAVPFYLKKSLSSFDLINPHNYPASLWVGLARLLSGRRFPKIVWSCNEPPRFLYGKICNAHTPYALQLNCGEVTEQLRVKLLSRIKIGGKELYKPALRLLDRFSVKQFTKIIALSKTVSRQVQRIYGIKNVETCYLGIREMDKGGEQKRIAGRYFLTVSRLEACKNIQNVIRAFAVLKKQGELNNTRYYIIGTGPLKQYLQKLVVDLQLENIVKMPGFVSREELLSYYQGCLAVIYVPYDEPYGLPYLEAAYFSKPALASDHGGPAELVKDGQSGRIVNSHDVDEIARKIEWFISNEQERKEMGLRAYENYKKEFTWQKYIERYKGMIKT